MLLCTTSRPCPRTLRTSSRLTVRTEGPNARLPAICRPRSRPSLPGPPGLRLVPLESRPLPPLPAHSGEGRSSSLSQPPWRAWGPGGEEDPAGMEASRAQQERGEGRWRKGLPGRGHGTCNGEKHSRRGRAGGSPGVCQPGSQKQSGQRPLTSQPHVPLTGHPPGPRPSKSMNE